MNKIFFTADTHFGHQKAIDYIFNDHKLRPWESTNDQDAALIENWNSIVSESDTVYHLGDVLDPTTTDMSIIRQLNGRKILIKGNLDTLADSEYLQYFAEVYPSFHIVNFNNKNFLMTHNYVARDFIAKNKCYVNLHGHLHADSVPDARYFCVSLEQTNFSPIELASLLERIELNQLKYIKNLSF